MDKELRLQLLLDLTEQVSVSGLRHDDELRLFGILHGPISTASLSRTKLMDLELHIRAVENRSGNIFSERVGLEPIKVFVGRELGRVLGGNDLVDQYVKLLLQYDTLPE